MPALALPLPAGKLDYELQVRGWRVKDLARLSGVSEPTLARARDGGPVTGATAAKIAFALKQQDPIPELVELYRQPAA